VKLFRSNFIIRIAILISIVVSAQASLHAQTSSAGEFSLSQDVSWSGETVPNGVYTFSVDTANSPVLFTLRRKGGGLVRAIVPQAISQPRETDPPGIFISGSGKGLYVESIRLEKLGLVLEFFVPGSMTDGRGPGSPQARPNPMATSSTLGFFTILNPGNLEMPAAEADKLYLSACEVVEREFNRATPLRPQLTLVLGADKDQVHYPSRQIQLVRWDKYRFTQGVVTLALEDMAPPDEKKKLSVLAVSKVDATVSLCELKSCGN
jgi:hypothetical protein